jgi:serine O-acetyltransferase
MQSNNSTPYSANFWQCVKRDLELLLIGKKRTIANRIFIVLTNRGFHAIFNYRLANACVKKRIPILPLIFTRTIQILYGIDISPNADLGPGIVIVHGVGIVIGSSSKIEGDCCIYHGVTLGEKAMAWEGVKPKDGHPHLEKAVMIGAGAKILGPINVGYSSIIGANSVVIKDVPPHSVAVGLPAKVVSRCEKSLFARN